MSASDREERNGHDDQISVIQSNASAVRAVASAVEGTLGPKGLDTMLVDESGEVLITNDGVTILDKMAVKHPAARMLINIARSQQDEVGDGTTTATVLASAMVEEGLRKIEQGVPVAKVIAGIQEAARLAIEWMRAKSSPIETLDDPVLYQIARIAGREQEDIARLIMEGAHTVGAEKLVETSYRFADSVVAAPGSEHEVISGVLISKLPVADDMPSELDQARILVMDDAFAPEEVDDEALGTEIGFQRYLELKDAFVKDLDKLVQLGVNLVIVDRSLDALAEEFCRDRGIMVVHRVAKKEIKRVMEHTGARSVKRTGLAKPVEELSRYLGNAGKVVVNHRMKHVRILDGSGTPTATILVGAPTPELVGERERIARDAASSVQAAVRSGYIPGGGAIELAASIELEKQKSALRGMESFGMEVVSHAMRRPLTQMIQNAGFSPLEKVEQVKATQIETGNHAFGLDLDTGTPVDMLEVGVVDPVQVKIQAVQAAAEVSRAILRIHTIIRMKEEE
ncbi:MAG: TCP-1/cpn60 chaperonin family protein [Bacillaceae bacterium]|nr:TCP-1/cpn60 chaperonin family protein [Bacillaceae bacterium]